ncbi:MAG: hypothetical protein AB7O96_16705 [Pseudobdellovibrionaceae bacterium]
MKILFFAIILGSASVHAMPDPRYASLTEITAFGSYIKENMNEIIDSSSELAEKAVPGKNYFLITEAVTLKTYALSDGAEPSHFATLKMSSSTISCNRDVLAVVKTSQWGARELTFSLAPTIDCK